MSDALARIEEDFQEYRDGVERCRSSKTEDRFSASVWKDAYDRLYRLSNRYLKEKKDGDLNKPEREECFKVFENDGFIISLLSSNRVVGSHVQKRGSLEIRTASGAPVTLVAGTSALAMFAAPVVALPTNKGNLHRIDHLADLEEAERRIARAFDKLRK